MIFKAEKPAHVLVCAFTKGGIHFSSKNMKWERVCQGLFQQELGHFQGRDHFLAF